MESKAVSEIKGVTLTMDLREAVAFLEDPRRAQEHVRSQLEGHGMTPPAASQGRKAHRATGKGGLKCDRCGKDGLTEVGRKLHVTRMHPETLKD